MTVTLAFYKGRGKTAAERILDSAIRLATRGVYSHVELIPGDAVFGRKQPCLSSSGRDGGVRERSMVLQPENWDLVTLPVEADGPCGFIRNHIGARYDYTGILFSQVLGFGRHSANRWFCSEICAAALGLRDPQRVSPQLLFDIVTWKRRMDIASDDRSQPEAISAA